MSCTTTWTTWWLLALVFTCLWLMLKWDKLASVYWGHVPHARHLCSGSVLKNTIPWDSIARHCPGKETYRKIHPKCLCNIDSVKFDTCLSKIGMSNTKMINMKGTLKENSIGYCPPLRRIFWISLGWLPLLSGKRYYLSARIYYHRYSIQQTLQAFAARYCFKSKCFHIPKCDKKNPISLNSEDHATFVSLCDIAKKLMKLLLEQNLNNK